MSGWDCQGNYLIESRELHWNVSYILLNIFKPNSWFPHPSLSQPFPIFHRSVTRPTVIKFPKPETWELFVFSLSFTLKSNPSAIYIGSTSKTCLKYCTSTSLHPHCCYLSPGTLISHLGLQQYLTSFYSTPADLLVQFILFSSHQSGL